MPKIAVIRLDNIGDHVLFSGFIRGLRENLPDANLNLFVSSCTQELYRYCPYINHTQVVPRTNPLQETIESAPSSHETENKSEFDLVINPRFAADYYHAAELAYKLQAPRRIAFQQENQATNSYYTDLVEAPDHFHVADYANILLKALFNNPRIYKPEIHVSHQDKMFVKDWLLVRRWDGKRPLIMLAPGASEDYRTLSLELVNALIEDLSNQAKVVLLDSASNAEKWQQVNHKGFINACGVFTLTQMAAAIKMSQLLIGTDSGPKHIAAAQGTAVVEIGFFPEDWPSKARGIYTSGECWGPYQVKNESIRPYQGFTREEVYSGCSIRSISASRILDAVRKCLTHD